MKSAVKFATTRTASIAGTIQRALFVLLVLAGNSLPAQCQSDITDIHFVNSMTRFWNERTGGRPINPGYTGDPSYDKTLRDIDGRLADMDRGGIGYPGGVAGGSAAYRPPQTEQFPIMFPSVGTGNDQLDRDYRIGRYRSGGYGNPSGYGSPSSAAGGLRVTMLLQGLSNVASRYGQLSYQSGRGVDARNWASWSRFFRNCAAQTPANLSAQSWLPANINFWQTVSARAHAQNREDIARFAWTYAAFWSDLDCQVKSGAPRLIAHFPGLMARMAP